MITGFNTDVEHDGVVYHVQTEDKGLKSPLILSLVYVKGTILASKRTPYEDLIQAGYDENKLAERLNRQHKLICAAIHAGRIEDLKRQTERDAGARAKPAEPAQAQPFQAEPIRQEPIQEAAPPEPAPAAHVGPPPTAEVQPPPTPPPPAPTAATPDMILVSNAEDEPAPVFRPKEPPPPPPPAFEEVAAPPPPQVPAATEHVDYSRVVDYYGSISEVEELQVNLLDEKKFVAGEFVKIHVHVARGDDPVGAVQGAAVTLKVLGSSFRPLIFTEKTGADGVATFYTMLPYFTSGRAAVLVSATADGHRAELRRIIHQA